MAALPRCGASLHNVVVVEWFLEGAVCVERGTGSSNERYRHRQAGALGSLVKSFRLLALMMIMDMSIVYCIAHGM